MPITLTKREVATLTAEAEAFVAERKIRESDTMTTNEKLKALGYTSVLSEHGRKIIFKHGFKVFEGVSHDVEAWLRKL